MKIYMAVTTDKYELPIAVFDNLSDLSAWNNRTKNACKFAILRKNIDKKLNCRYVRVNLEEGENEKNE